MPIFLLVWHTWTMKLLRYIELKSGYSDNGPAWIAFVTPSQTGRTLYFNGRGLMKRKGQRRGESGGNYVDTETGESFGSLVSRKMEEIVTGRDRGKLWLNLRPYANISKRSNPRP